MVQILLTGCAGKMGRAITNTAALREDCVIAAGVDTAIPESSDYPVYRTFSDVQERIDVIIDFSNPVVLDSMLDYAVKNKIPAVICTTGYSKEQIEKIHNAAKEIAIFYSGNMSLGINLLIELSKKAASVFGNEFDIEIIEKHHNLKLDAPSGTALMIANGISEIKDDAEYVYDRHSYRRKREQKEIGLHSVRGGTIVGEHEVIFAGNDEILTISHSARSKNVFAVGAVNAAVFLVEKPAGMYEMSDLLAEK